MKTRLKSCMFQEAEREYQYFIFMACHPFLISESHLFITAMQSCIPPSYFSCRDIIKLGRRNLACPQDDGQRAGL